LKQGSQQPKFKPKTAEKQQLCACRGIMGVLEDVMAAVVAGPVLSPRHHHN
jgi:hypothetical protein